MKFPLYNTFPLFSSEMFLDVLNIDFKNDASNKDLVFLRFNKPSSSEVNSDDNNEYNSLASFIMKIKCNKIIVII